MNRPRHDLRFLVVEDDPTQRLVLVRHLERFATVTPAATGEDAIRRFGDALDAGRGFAAVFLDLRLPGLGGIEVLRAVRAIESGRTPPAPSCRVVMTTMVADSPAIAEAFTHRCDAYLVKPVMRFDLVDTLRQLGLLPAG